MGPGLRSRINSGRLDLVIGFFYRLLRKNAMIVHTVRVPKEPFSFDQLGSLFGEIASLLKLLIPILLGIITMFVYYLVIPLSILAIVFTFINQSYNKQLPAYSLSITSVIFWLWLVIIVLLK
jgi:hypothetical protein